MDFLQKIFGGKALNFMGLNYLSGDDFVPTMTRQPKFPSFLLNFQDKKKINIFPEGGQAAEIPAPPPQPEVPLFDPFMDLPPGAPPEMVEEFFANLPLPPLPAWAQQQQQLQEAAAAAHQEVEDFFANLPLPPIPEWAQLQQQEQEAQQQQAQQEQEPQQNGQEQPPQE